MIFSWGDHQPDDPEGALWDIVVIGAGLGGRVSVTGKLQANGGHKRDGGSVAISTLLRRAVTEGCGGLEFNPKFSARFMSTLASELCA